MSTWLDAILPIELPLGEMTAEEPELTASVQNLAASIGLPADAANARVLSALAQRQIKDLLRNPVGATNPDTQETTAFKVGLIHGLLIARALASQCQQYVKSAASEQQKEPAQ